MPSVGTICSKVPLMSRARRTAPVVALMGTSTVRLVPSAATLVAAAVCSDSCPELFREVKTTLSPASRPTPVSVIVWPTLAEAIAG